MRLLCLLSLLLCFYFNGYGQTPQPPIEDQFNNKPTLSVEQSGQHGLQLSGLSPENGLPAGELNDLSLPLVEVGSTFGVTAIEGDYYRDRFIIKLYGHTRGLLPRITITTANQLPAHWQSIYDQIGQPVIRPASSLPEPVMQTYFMVEFPAQYLEQHPEFNPFQLMAVLRQLPDVEHVEQMPIMRTYSWPNDIRPEQWQFSRVNADGLWPLGANSSPAVVAIVDDAVRTSHNDIFPNLWINSREIAGNGRDDDFNGFIDDVNGYDVADRDANPNPFSFALSWGFQSHGTHCAGIASAATNNGTGIASLGYNTRIMAVKCSPNFNLSATIPNAFEGVDYAIKAGANVISMSWGGYGYSRAFEDLFNVASSRGIVLVAAAGNDNRSDAHFPAAYRPVIGVGASDEMDRKANFSNFGRNVDIMAPGTNIFSCWGTANNVYARLSGTSMATPMVAGLAGYLKSRNATLTPDQILSCIQTSADNIDAINPGFWGQLGSGRINAGRAVQCAGGGSVGFPPVASFNWNVSSGCSPLTISFRDLSSNTPTSWQWDINNDGITDYFTQNPTHTYTTPGTYSVRLTVSNAAGSQSSLQFSIITVNASRPIFVNPSEVNVCSGNTATVVASGMDSYRWLPDFGQINNSPVFNFVPTSTVTLTVTGTSGSCTGSQTVRVNVWPMPGVSAWASGSTVTINATGGLSPYRYSLQFGSYQSSNTFSGVSPGTYNVLVLDARGCVGMGIVQVSGGNATTCNSPTNLRVNASSSTALEASWSAVSGASYYTVRVRPSNGSSSWNSLISINNSTIVSGLVANTSYEVSIIAHCTNDRQSEPSGSAFATTPPQVATCFGPSFTITNVNPTSLSLSWPLITNAANYRLRIRNTRTGVTDVYNIAGSQSSYVVGGLMPGTNYEISMQTDCFGNTSSPLSGSAFVTTPDQSVNQCAIPTNLSVVPGTIVAHIFWSPVAGATGYNVNWRERGSSTWRSMYVPGTGNSYTITGLLMNTSYEYSIQAQCNNSASERSNWFGFTTRTNQRIGQDVASATETTSWSLYPNPNNGRFSIEWPADLIPAASDVPSAVAVAIYDWSGRLVWEKALPSCMSNTTIDLGQQLAAGIYLIHCTAGNSRFSERLMIQP
jgi:hypothetical protein